MENKKICLYLDDNRTPVKSPPGFSDWVVVRSYDEFVNYIKTEGVPEYISFDHDLSLQHDNDFAMYQLQGIHAINYQDFTEKTGLDAAKFLCEWVAENEVPLPKYLGVHSDNPAGAANIQSYINGFQKHMGWDQNCFIQKPEFIIENRG